MELWIKSQDKSELLKVERVRLIETPDKTVNILAKLERETVILGTYSPEQGARIMEELAYALLIDNQIFEMPKGWEEES